MCNEIAFNEKRQLNVSGSIRSNRTEGIPIPTSKLIIKSANEIPTHTEFRSGERNSDTGAALD